MTYDQKTCPECKRHLANVPNPVLRRSVHSALTQAYVLHAFYGCDTGCDGYIAYAEDEQGNTCQSKFEFAGPYGGDHEEFARAMCMDKFPDVPFNWSKCRVVDL